VLSARQVGADCRSGVAAGHRRWWRTVLDLFHCRHTLKLTSWSSSSSSPSMT